MPFCNKCGKEYPAGARFCSSCGKEQIIATSSCVKCGKTLEENEKFCSSCGNPTNADKKVAPKLNPESKPEPPKPKYTKEGKKIINAGPGSVNKRPTKKSPATMPVPKRNSSQKKKRISLGCFFRTLLILISIVLASALIIIVVNVFFVEDDGSAATSTQKIDDKEDGGLTDTNIPGIVDIEPGDVSHLPENRNEETEPAQVTSIKEDSDIKRAAKSVEDAFANADTTQIKLLLTKSGLSTYSGILKEIQPQMKEYANAFKNRKLITSTDIYQVYEFYDENGEKYTTAFELQPDGNWKLTRF